MTDTLVIKARVQYAINGDFSSLPIAIDYGVGKDFIAVAAEQTETRQSIPTAGQTISLSTFTTLTAIYIKNEDLTNYVSATWTRATGTLPERIDIPAQQIAIIPGMGIDLTSLTLTANTATCLVTAIVVGS